MIKKESHTSCKTEILLSKYLDSCLKQSSLVITVYHVKLLGSNKSNLGVIQHGLLVTFAPTY